VFPRDLGSLSVDEIATDRLKTENVPIESFRAVEIRYVNGKMAEAIHESHDAPFPAAAVGYRSLFCNVSVTERVRLGDESKMYFCRFIGNFRLRPGEWER
jgi:hypothetical protein